MGFIWLQGRRFVMGEVVGVSIVPFYYFAGGGVHHGVEQVLPIWGVACRGLAMMGWNRRVGSEVRVVPVIGQYLVLVL